MRAIKKLVKQIGDEIKSAREYAERYMEHKADGDIEMSERFRTMASEEISHADTIHKLAVSEIDKLSKVFSPPAEMIHKWNEMHENYTDMMSIVKDIIK